MSMGKTLGDHRYRIGCPIAKGAFSTVYRCVDLATGKAYAVKVVNRALVETNKMQEAVVREINAMEVVTPSRYLVNLVDKLVSARNYYLIMDLVEGGTLVDCIRNAPSGLSLQWCCRIFRQLLNGLSLLHRCNIVHRDIKPENLLLNAEHTQLMISDFGFACYAPSGRLLRRACGTPNYCAPELLQQDPHYDGRKVDVWAAGVTLYVMLFNKYPFQGSEGCPDALLQAVTAGRYTFPRPVPPGLEHLFSVMLQPQPAKRWSVSKLLRHTWVLGITPIVTRVPSHTNAVVKDMGSVNDECGPPFDAFLLRSQFAQALEDDDLCASSRRSRSCPPLLLQRPDGDLVFSPTGLDDDVNAGSLPAMHRNDSRRGPKMGYFSSNRGNDGSGDGEKCSGVVEVVGRVGGTTPMDPDSVYSYCNSESSFHSNSLHGNSFLLNSSTATITSPSTYSKAACAEAPVSYMHDLVLTLKAIANFFLFCTALFVIGGMRLLLDVDFNDLPLPLFFRNAVERLLTPLDGGSSQYVEPQRHHQTRGERLREIVASAGRAISRFIPRRRVALT
ncbi:Small Surface Antigen [Trypanosoma rangeli]|uniref:Small Surface Antigen n=1 Tax=Trypanosoma rangeli TaxID=5698 RepID=A0A3R7LT21_TRYRA|nr:Small Surface Antigen [Trypanosoma rangeli]RNF02801.1 Small Surface Antigen [Trypanosoma rangeli]|eukprot:RNF02801.1 Small Surface Antigen [Trypanosoma rangeli]